MKLKIHVKNVYPLAWYFPLYGFNRSRIGMSLVWIISCWSIQIQVHMHPFRERRIFLSYAMRATFSKIIMIINHRYRRSN